MPACQTRPVYFVIALALLLPASIPATAASASAGKSQDQDLDEAQVQGQVPGNSLGPNLPPSLGEVPNAGSVQSAPAEPVASAEMPDASSQSSDDGTSTVEQTRIPVSDEATARPPLRAAVNGADPDDDATRSAPHSPENSSARDPRIMARLTPPTDGAANNAATASADSGGYRLGAGDKVRVIVYGEDDLGGEFDVDGSGFIRLPLIGQVQAAGLTVHAFEAQVAAKLADGYINDPRVSAEVTAYRPFFIIGEVNKPGEYPYVNGMSVVTAVALAGGYTYRADDSDVYVRRDGSIREVEKPADATTSINPGDIIRVTERFF